MKNWETFTFTGGIKICNVYPKLNRWGRFLYQNSVRSHEVGMQKPGMADGSAAGNPIVDLVCRTYLAEAQTCQDCKVLAHFEKQNKK